MKREVLEMVGNAAYDERLAIIAAGIYPKSAFTIPGPTHYYTWDKLDEEHAFAFAIRSLFQQEAQAAIEAFFLYIYLHTDGETRGMLTDLLAMVEPLIYTKDEIAQKQEHV